MFSSNISLKSGKAKTWKYIIYLISTKRHTYVVTSKCQTLWDHVTWLSKNADFRLTGRSLYFISSLLSLCTFTILSSILTQCRDYAENASVLPMQCFTISDKMPWGGAPACPACNKTVYPMEQAIAADRKPFHAGCIRCQMKGCG